VKPSAIRSVAAAAGASSSPVEDLALGSSATQFRCSLYFELLRLVARVLTEYRQKDL
jgi:hypothetical protein